MKDPYNIVVDCNYCFRFGSNMATADHRSRVVQDQADLLAQTLFERLSKSCTEAVCPFKDHEDE